MFSNTGFVKEVQKLSKIQKACATKNCKKEYDAVQKLSKAFKKNTDAISKKITNYAVDLKNGKMTRDKYIDHIMKEVKYGFKLIDEMIHSKEVNKYTECTLTHCLTEFKNSLKILIQMLDTVCKDMHIKVGCEAKSGFEKMEKQDKISANEYLALVTKLFKEAEKMMAR